MSAKYDPNEDRDSKLWRSDKRHVLAQWQSKPFVGHHHRSDTVEQRIVVEYNHGVGADFMHQARSDDTEKFPDDWATIQTIETRSSNAYYWRAPEMRWLE